LSPTLKLRRAVIYKKYQHILEEIYGHGADKTENMGKEAGTDSFESTITNGLKKLIRIKSDNKD
jgi:hypothetical protein